MVKNVIFRAVLFLGALSFSCDSNDALTMSTAHTIRISKEDKKEDIMSKASHVVPTENQYQALQDNFMCFIHFGVNTFTGKEWGNGFENPQIFNPRNSRHRPVVQGY